MTCVGRAARCAAAVMLSAGCGVPALAGSGDFPDTGAPPGGPERGELRPAAGVLRLRHGRIDLDPASSLLEGPAGAFTAGRRYVLAFDGPMTPARHAALSAAGLVYEGYLPDNAAIVRAGGPVRAEEVRGLGFVTWAGPYADDWKLDPQLSRPARRFSSDERRAIEVSGRRAVVAYLFDGEALTPFLDALRAVPGAAYLSSEEVGETRSVFLTVPASQLSRLARLGAVRFVEEMPEFEVRNNSSRWIVQSNQANVTPLYDHGLTGAGQILGLIDNKISSTHCSFTDALVPITAANTPGTFPTHRKILAYNTTYGPTDFHGTHVAGTAVGDNGVFDDTRGLAYAAKLVYNDFPQVNEASVYSRFYLHYSQGAAVHNSSWGNNGTTAYDGTCRAIDNLSWQYDDNLLVFAVADSSAIIKNPENAKNCLAVSSTGDTPNQDSACGGGGSGPTPDGRRKPEIMAPGCAISSAYYNSTCGLIIKSGTSMACPAVSGVALMVRQYFMDGYYPSGAPNAPDAFTPSGALIKAVLVNAAVDMSGIAGNPSNQEGWGRLLADNALYFPGDASKLLVRDVRNNADGALQTGVEVPYYFLVNGPGSTFRATLAYHDAPATLPATFAPVNVVYLKVTAPDSTVYYGNVVTNGASVPGGSPDTINNLQQVIVPAPAPGVWTVSLVAQAVNVGVQGYAFALTGDVQELCPADFDHNTFVNGDDFDAFSAAFDAGDPSADFDHNSFVNGDDFDAFAIAFQAGC